MKKIKLLLVLLICLIPSQIWSNSDVKLFINGNYIKSDVAPIIENGRTLVPLRVISENLGISVKWDSENKSVTTYKETASGSDFSKSLLLKIGDNKVVKPDESGVNTNEALYTLEVAPKIVNGRTMVPIRFIAEAYNLKVDWDSKNKTVVIGEGYKAPSVATKPKQTKKIPYFDGRIAEIEDIKIEITNFKVIQPGQTGNEYGDKPVIAFWYKTTNKTDKEINSTTAWLAIFTAIQDNNNNMINELQVSSLPDDRFLNTQLNAIKKNGTIENAVAYELSDITTPVTLKATQGIFGKKIGTYNYNIK
ncbi:MAG: stalk domain-containing protein [Peptoniphilaceae bacterium]|nr:stalk domain-containing protein [Peptoniphilaceae bacterium]